MANDVLQAMVRDELFWNPGGRQRRGRSPVSTAKAKPPERVKASPGSASPDQRQNAAMWSPFAPIADYGVRVGLPYGALVAPETCLNMTIIVSDGKTLVAAGAK